MLRDLFGGKRGYVGKYNYICSQVSFLRRIIRIEFMIEQNFVKLYE